MASDYLKIEEVVGAESDSAWVIGFHPLDKDKAAATDPGQAMFIVARKLGFENVTIEKCYELVGLGRRAAIAATKAKDKAKGHEVTRGEEEEE